ncbi:hypothetical protein [Nocardioides ungokensis]|uniref:hypothetical protein n=1 Tax=Nocardioides ungokensis TaxID=1643322 RepID=UPI0015DE96B0|nr:hypothetical protein [Nocardioides ungokensis]
MSARLWYLRHGVAWLPVLACCAAAAATALLVVRWPDVAGVLAPTVLAPAVPARLRSSTTRTPFRWWR